MGAVALLVRDPHGSGSWGACPVNALTGGYCPGCGSLRGVHDLLVGHVTEAVGHNLLLLPALGWMAWWWVKQVDLAGTRRLPPVPSSAGFCVALVVVLALFTAVRNLPGSPLAP